MANTIASAAFQKHVLPTMQVLLEKRMTGVQIANTKTAAKLTHGDAVDFNRMSARMRAQTYTPGTDLENDNVEVSSDRLNITESTAVVWNFDDKQQDQLSSSEAFRAQCAAEGSYVLANDLDQKVLAAGVSAAGFIDGVSTPAALTDSTTFDLFTGASAQLEYGDATGADRCSVIDPLTHKLIKRELAASGNNLMDSVFAGGYKGMYDDFKAYVSNNLESTVVLNFATQPTAGDTVVLYGVTFEWIADGGTAAATEGTVQLKVGADIADAKAILLSAINNTTIPTAGDYAITLADRRKLQQRSVAASAFVGDVTTITGYGRINASSNLTAAADKFGQETNNLLFCEKGAISLGMQTMPTLRVTDATLRFEDIYKLRQLHGQRVFTNDVPRIVKYANIVKAAE